MTQYAVYVLKTEADNGGEYTSKEFMDFCKGKGIVIEYTPPYTPQLNGVSERMNRTLCEKAKAMLAEAKLPKFLWSEAVRTAAFLTNRTATVTLPDKTPAEVWFGKKPDLSKLRIFGCRAWALIPKRSKLDDKAQLCYMVGYSDTGYMLYNPATKSVFNTHDVKFDELSCLERVAEVPGTPATEEVDEEAEDADSDASIETVVEQELDDDDPDDLNDTIRPRVNDPTDDQLPRRSNRIANQLANLDVPALTSTVHHHASLCTSDEVPANFASVSGRPDELKWRRAIDDELSSHKQN